MITVDLRDADVIGDLGTVEGRRDAIAPVTRSQLMIPMA